MCRSVCIPQSRLLADYRHSRTLSSPRYHDPLLPRSRAYFERKSGFRMLGDDRMELRCGQATALSAILLIVPFLLCAPFVGAGNYYSYASTIGVLA
jgi:hypothetical protein